MKNIPLFGSENLIPQTVGQLDYQEITYFDNPDMGIQLRYSSPDGIKADVYLYDLGIDHISNDIKSSEVLEFFQGACQDVFTMEKRGMLADLEVRSSQYLSLNEDEPIPTYLWASFYYRQSPNAFTTYEGMRYSHLALRTDDGYINKIRYTYPDNLEEIGRMGFALFLSQWYQATQQTKI